MLMLLSVRWLAAVRAGQDTNPAKAPFNLCEWLCTHTSGNPAEVRHRLAGIAGHTDPDSGIGHMTVAVAACVLGVLQARCGARTWVVKCVR